MELLVTLPQYDKTTAYASAWSQKIISMANNLGVKVLDIENPNRNNFESYIESNNADLMVLNGHGSTTCVEGEDEEPMLQKNDNEDLTKDKIVYARTCSSAKELGPSCVENGAKAYIGYEDKFNFIIQTKKTTKPLEDKVAELCLYPSNQVPISLLKGKTAKEAYGRSQQEYQEALRDALTNYELDSGEIFKSVAWNMEVQKLSGDTEADIKQVQ
ncbi:MAG: hypothetical protein ABEJ56_01490 [Candidatus Nanohaloarchaea archaeon]